MGSITGDGDRSPMAGRTALRRGGRFGNVGLMKFAPSKLFHAVVVTGAALTGCAGTGPRPAAPANTAAAAGSTATAPASTTEAGGINQSGGTCPPGSERPFPPCYWIK
jgi:hypothetical protein